MSFANNLNRLALAACVFAAAATTAACDGITVPPRSSTDVYDFRLRGDTLHVFHWALGKEVRVFVKEPADATLRATLLNAFDHGAEQWNAYALFGEYHLSRTTSLAEADVVLQMSNDFSPVNTSECPPVLSSGSTTFCLIDPTAKPLRLKGFPPLAPADTTATNIKMLVTILSSQASIAGRIQILVAHELGHVLGIGQHSPDQGDLMVGGLPTRSTLSQRDIATVQVLYHTVPDILP